MKNKDATKNKMELITKLIEEFDCEIVFKPKINKERKMKFVKKNWLKNKNS